MHRLAFFSLLTALLLPGILPAATLPPDLGKRLVTGYIQPATQDFLKASSELADTANAYCAAPAEPARRDALQNAFRHSVEAWTGLEFLRFGPLVENNRLEKVFFFPDARGVTLRQLQALLASRDAEALKPDVLKTRSVAVQGLPALEFLLYGNDADTQIRQQDEAGRYRCALAAAIAVNVQALAREIAEAWSGEGRMAREFSAPSATQALYRNPGEVATESVKALSTALQFTRDVKLLPALGASSAEARGQRAPLWRSGLTAHSLTTSAKHVLAFYNATGFAMRMPPGDRWIDDSLQSETRALLADYAEATLPFEQAVTDEEQRAALLHATLVLKNMKAVVDEFLAGSFAINIGFNSLDGD